MMLPVVFSCFRDAVTDTIIKPFVYFCACFSEKILCSYHGEIIGFMCIKYFLCNIDWKKNIMAMDPNICQ